MGEEEEIGSEDELENGNNKEEGEETVSNAAEPLVEKVNLGVHSSVRLPFLT